MQSRQLLYSTTTVSNHGIQGRRTHLKRGHQVELLMIYLGFVFKRILGARREFCLSLNSYSGSQTDEERKSLARPLQQAILSHLESSPESKATGSCNTIVKVPTISGSRLVAQNTESEVVSTAIVQNNQVLNSISQSFRRSECTDRRLATSISNSQHSL